MMMIPQSRLMKKCDRYEKKAKYARESTRNYGNRVRCIVIRFSLYFSTSTNFSYSELDILFVYNTTFYRDSSDLSGKDPC